MPVVGLTGGIGSGKSAAADAFEALGAAVVDTDRIAHGLTAAGGAAMAAVARQFGPGVIASDGSLDRDAMRSRVFSDGDARRQLEAILHPMIRQAADRAVAEASGRAPYVMLVVPLLIESGAYRQRVDRVCVVDVPESLQIARVMARNGFDEARVRSIMAAQASRQARLDAADDVIDNGGSLDALQDRVRQLDALYRGLRAC
ncbi:MAG: dephospho-CoA kinase [Rhodocyclaceae bacterium]|nr:dephospho-CoA kinase [Rhodocyclaceae bacterium]